MTDHSPSAAEMQTLLSELHYCIGNPSAWEHYDDAMSERLRAALSYIRQLEKEHRAMQVVLVAQRDCPGQPCEGCRTLRRRTLDSLNIK